MKSDSTLQNFLEQFTDALLAGDEHARDILAEFDALTYDDKSYDDVLVLMSMIEQLQTGFAPVKPRAEFKTRLKYEVLQTRPNVVVRWRFLPARVQIAALSVVVGGFLFLLRGLLLGEGRRKAKEVTV